MLTMRKVFAANLVTVMGRMPAAELARALGVSESAVCRWLKAQRLPDLERIAEIARVLDVSVDALISEQQA